METPTTTPNLYLLDTCALIEFDNFFNPESWGPVWDFLDELTQNKQLLIIDDVYLELERMFPDSAITLWCKKNKATLHYPYKSEHFVYLSEEVHAKCNVIDEDKTSPVYADPLLLAVAGCDSLILVTHENFKPGLQAGSKPEKIKIPNHCSVLGIQCLYGPHIWKNLLQNEKFSLASK